MATGQKTFRRPGFPVRKGPRLHNINMRVEGGVQSARGPIEDIQHDIGVFSCRVGGGGLRLGGASRLQLRATGAHVFGAVKVSGRTTRTNHLGGVHAARM